MSTIQENEKVKSNAIRKAVLVSLYKTRFCPFLHQKGKCARGDSCLFAHKEDEFRLAPNLSKTKLCPSIKKNVPCTYASVDTIFCPYAHSIEELRHTNNIYKTKYCHMFKKGRCTAGNMCRHAHGFEEYSYYRRVANMSVPSKCSQEMPKFNSDSGDYNFTSSDTAEHDTASSFVLKECGSTLPDSLSPMSPISLHNNKNLEIDLKKFSYSSLTQALYGDSTPLNNTDFSPDFSPSNHTMQQGLWEIRPNIGSFDLNNEKDHNFDNQEMARYRLSHPNIFSSLNSESAENILPFTCNAINYYDYLDMTPNNLFFENRTTSKFPNFQNSSDQIICQSKLDHRCSLNASNSFIKTNSSQELSVPYNRNYSLNNTSLINPQYPKCNGPINFSNDISSSEIEDLLSPINMDLNALKTLESQYNFPIFTESKNNADYYSAYIDKNFSNYSQDLAIPENQMSASIENTLKNKLIPLNNTGKIFVNSKASLNFEKIFYDQKLDLDKSNYLAVTLEPEKDVVSETLRNQLEFDEQLFEKQHLDLTKNKHDTFDETLIDSYVNKILLNEHLKLLKNNTNSLNSKYSNKLINQSSPL